MYSSDKLTREQTKFVNEILTLFYNAIKRRHLIYGPNAENKVYENVKSLIKQ